MVERRGEPLVAHASRFLAPRVAQLWISANCHTDFYAHYGMVVGDDPRYGSSSGPLAGVASGLAVSATPWLAVVPVGVPALPPAFPIGRASGRESVGQEGEIYGGAV